LAFRYLVLLFTQYSYIGALLSYIARFHICNTFYGLYYPNTSSARAYVCIN